METKYKRLFEMIPGSITLGFIALMVFLSMFYPVLAAYVIVFYSVYFIYQSIFVVLLMFRTSNKVQKTLKTNWMEQLETLDKREAGEWQKLYHAIIIPFANEGDDVLRPTVQCISDNNYPANRKILILATEDRLENGFQVASRIKNDFEKGFFKILITRHKLVAGEIVGKASNENWAARELFSFIQSENIDPTKVIVSSNDSDSRHNINYMARLSHSFLTQTEPLKRIYQPIPMFFNNIWTVSFISRIIATFSAQWQMALALKPHRFMNFSCYAICLETLHKIGYWDPSIIPEDERIYWRAVLYYGKDLAVVPLFLPVFLDAVKAKTYTKSLREQYIQIRRWAWGASEIAFSLPNIVKSKKIPTHLKILYISQQLRKSFEWALAPFILLFGLSLPSYLNPEFSKNILSYSLPFILSKILTLTTCLMITVFYIEAVFAPPKPTEWSILRRGFSLVQWAAFPFVSIIFSAIPAIEAQVRLIINKPIQYKATEKAQ